MAVNWYPEDMDVKNSTLGRLEGRLFVEAGRLCMVVEVDEEAGIGRVSTRIDGTQQVIEMPIAEVGRRISLGANLVLDNVSESELAKRIVRKKDGWFFSAREGLQGPYRSGEEAEKRLTQHVLATNSA